MMMVVVGGCLVGDDYYVMMRYYIFVLCTPPCTVDSGDVKTENEHSRLSVTLVEAVDICGCCSREVKCSHRNAVHMFDIYRSLNK